MKTKVCSKCQEEKPLSEYTKNKKCKFGVNSFCKICKSKQNKIWREQNKERIKIREEKRRQRPGAKEKKRIYDLKYRERNFEKLNEQRK